MLCFLAQSPVLSWFVLSCDGLKVRKWLVPGDHGSLLKVVGADGADGEGLCAPVISKTQGNATVPSVHVITRSWRHLPQKAVEELGSSSSSLL